MRWFKQRAEARAAHAERLRRETAEHERKVAFASTFDYLANLSSGSYRTMGEAFAAYYDALDAGYRAVGIEPEQVVHFSRTLERDHVAAEYEVEGKIRATHDWLEITCPICLTGRRRAKTS